MYYNNITLYVLYELFTIIEYFSGKLWLYFYKTTIFYLYLYNFFIISSKRGELFVNFGKLTLQQPQQ